MEKPFRNLQRIVPAEPQTGGGIQILGLELYDDGLAIRWGALPSEPNGLPSAVARGGLDPVQLSTLTYGALPEPSAFPETIYDGPTVTNVVDDRQTSYEPAGSSGDAIRGVAFFTPAIAREATWLEVQTRDGTVMFDL